MRALAIAASLVTLVIAVAPAHAASALPTSFVRVRTGGDGGSIWIGRIPNREVSWDRRASAIYLPPNFSPDRRYPVLYLLHGMRGAPSSFWDSLNIADVLDRLIAAGRVPPLLAVMPVAGPRVDPGGGEWAGAWERYVVRDVVPWVDAHLPTIPSPRARGLVGICAGGYGALDIALRHPGLFGTLGAWDAYFRPFRDGPFVHASRADIAAHTPALLVRADAAALRRDRVEVFLSTGRDHRPVLARWTFAFARELRTLGIGHELWVLPHGVRDFWRAQLPAALAYSGSRLVA